MNERPHRTRRLFSRAQPIIFFLLVLVAWEAIPALFSVPKYIFPRISTIFEALFEARDAVLINAKTTLVEAIAGFLLGSYIGFSTGVLMAESKFVARSILPYVIASNAIPIVAIAPLVVIWFGHGLISKIVLAAFLCFFPLCINVYRGLNEFDPMYKEVFDVYGANSLEFLTKFKLRNALPYVFIGLKLNATFSVIGAVVAEFVGATSGLGFGMLQASYTLNTPRLFAYLILSCLMGLTLYGFVYMTERVVLNTEHHEP